MKLVLDTNVLGKIVHPRAYLDVKEWFRDMLESPHRPRFYLPEIADFELRRELIHRVLRESLQNLDRLPSEIGYLPITTAIMRDAARLWAELQTSGQAVDDVKALGGDVILAAQALSVRATVVTDNTKDLQRMVKAVHWYDITIP